MKKIGMVMVFVVCCLVLAVYMVGCGTSGGDATTTTTSTTTTTVVGGASYFPHTDGYKWTYAVTVTSSPTPITLINWFDGTEEVSGHTTQIYKAYSGSSTQESNCYCTSSSVKLYNSTTFSSPEVTWLIFPFTVGDSWIFYDDYLVTVEAYQLVSVPCGTYESFYLRLASGSNSFNMWFADGVGLIKFVYLSPLGCSTQELVSKNF